MPPKAGSTSLVWKYAVKVDKCEARCKVCGQQLKTSSNTSNVWNHLEKHGIRSKNAADAASLAKIINTPPFAASVRPCVVSETDEHFDTADPDNDLGDAEEPNRDSAEQGPSNRDTRQRTEATDTPSAKRRRSGPGKYQATIEKSFQRVSSFKAGGEKDAELRDALLYMEMDQTLPLSFSDGAGFKHFMSKCVPLWQPPSRRTVTRLMEEKYEIVSGIVRERLRELPSLCLTADCWTESHSTSGYLGVTAHYLRGVSMESTTIGLVRLHERHTNIYLEAKLRDICAEWAIDPLHVEAAITDNADNIRIAAKKVFGEAKNLPCYDHTLNLVPKAALGCKTTGEQYVAGVPDLIMKVKQVITFSHMSVNFSDALKKIQIQQFGKTEGTTLRLLQDVPTRWGSTYTMLERWFELQPAVLLAASTFPNVTRPTAADHQSLQSIMTILKPFHEVTKELSAEKCTTLSKCIPLYLLLKAVGDTPVVAGSVAANFKTFVTGELSRRFGNMESNRRVAAATVVDPRFMKAYFQSPVAASTAVMYLEDEVKKELLLRLTDAPTAAGEATQAARAREDTGNTHAGALWRAHEQLVAASRQPSTIDDISVQARSEMRSYLNRDIVSIHLDPLVLWEEMKPQYPGLYTVARRLLSIPATSVSSERGFSRAGDIVDDKGNRISSTHLAQRLFLGSVDIETWEKARLLKDKN